MPPQERVRIIMLLLLIVMIGIVGLGVIVAILVAWRNYNTRQNLVDEGQLMRKQQFSDEKQDNDLWQEAGRRYTEADGSDAPNDLDFPEHDDDDRFPER